MSANIILNGLTREELQEDIVKAFAKLIGVNKKTESWGFSLNGTDYSFESVPSANEKKSTSPNEKYLTRGEVANFLKISLPTLHRYTKDGVLKSFRIVGKVRYKLEDVENALKERNFGLPKKGGLNG